MLMSKFLKNASIDHNIKNFQHYESKIKYEMSQ